MTSLPFPAEARVRPSAVNARALTVSSCPRGSPGRSAWRRPRAAPRGRCPPTRGSSRPARRRPIGPDRRAHERGEFSAMLRVPELDVLAEVRRRQGLAIRDKARALTVDGAPSRSFVAGGSPRPRPDRLSSLPDASVRPSGENASDQVLPCGPGSESRRGPVPSARAESAGPRRRGLGFDRRE